MADNILPTCCKTVIAIHICGCNMNLPTECHRDPQTPGQTPHRVTHRLRIDLPRICILCQDNAFLEHVHEAEDPNQPPGRRSLEPMPPAAGDGQGANIPHVASQPVHDRGTAAEEIVVGITETGRLSATTPRPDVAPNQQPVEGRMTIRHSQAMQREAKMRREFEGRPPRQPEQLEQCVAPNQQPVEGQMTIRHSQAMQREEKMLREIEGRPRRSRGCRCIQ